MTLLKTQCTAPWLHMLATLLGDHKTLKSRACVEVALSLLPYGNALVHHALLCLRLQPQMPVGQIREQKLEHDMLEALQLGEQLLDSFTHTPPKGYIWQIKKSRSPHGISIHSKLAPLVHS